MILVAYNKKTGDVFHYVFCGGEIQPTLLGLYNACIQKNYPNLSFDDLGEYWVDEKRHDESKESYRDKIVKHSAMRVQEDSNGKPIDIIFDKLGVSDPPAESEDAKRAKKIKDLEDTVAKQQQIIATMAQKLGITV